MGLKWDFDRRLYRFLVLTPVRWNEVKDSLAIIAGFVVERQLSGLVVLSTLCNRQHVQYYQYDDVEYRDSTPHRLMSILIWATYPAILVIT